MTDKRDREPEPELELRTSDEIDTNVAWDSETIIENAEEQGLTPAGPQNPVPYFPQPDDGDDPPAQRHA